MECLDEDALASAKISGSVLHSDSTSLTSGFLALVANAFGKRARALPGDIHELWIARDLL